MILENPLRNRNLKDKNDNFAADLDDKIYKYLVDNFFYNLGFNYIAQDNLNYLVDSLKAHRAAFYSVGYYDLVEEMNYFLDILVEYLPNIDLKNKYQHKEQFYKEPSLNFKEKFLAGIES